jgi:hypothetical protein
MICCTPALADAQLDLKAALFSANTLDLVYARHSNCASFHIENCTVLWLLLQQHLNSVMRCICGAVVARN